MPRTVAGNPYRQRTAIDLHLRLGHVAFYSHPKRLMEWLLPATESAVAMGDQLRLAQGRIAQAGVLIYQGAPREALSLAEEALPVAMAPDNAALLAPCLRVTGHALALYGQFGLALSTLEEAIPLHDRLNSHLDRVAGPRSRRSRP